MTMKTTRKHIGRLSRKLKIKPPWCLPNHMWYPKTWSVPANSVLREAYNSQLVRRHEWRRDQWFTPDDRFAKLDTASAAIEAFNILEVLTNRARQGDAEAGGWLADIVMRATASMRKIANSSPKAFQVSASTRYAWPVIKKKREALSSDEKDYFAAIQLGKDSIIETDSQTAKWKADDAGFVANSLLLRLHAARDDKRFDFGELSLATSRLKDFTDDSAGEWWELAKQVLLATYPAPESVAELNCLVNSPSKRKSPGRIRQAIFDTLKNRFLSFAKPGQAYQT